MMQKVGVQLYWTPTTFSEGIVCLLSQRSNAYIGFTLVFLAE